MTKGYQVFLIIMAVGLLVVSPLPRKNILAQSSSENQNDPEKVSRSEELNRLLKDLNIRPRGKNESLEDFTLRLIIHINDTTGIGSLEKIITEWKLPYKTNHQIIKNCGITDEDKIKEIIGDINLVTSNTNDIYFLIENTLLEEAVPKEFLAELTKEGKDKLRQAIYNNNPRIEIMKLEIENVKKKYCPLNWPKSPNCEFFNKFLENNLLVAKREREEAEREIFIETVKKNYKYHKLIDSLREYLEKLITEYREIAPLDPDKMPENLKIRKNFLSDQIDLNTELLEKLKSGEDEFVRIQLILNGLD